MRLDQLVARRGLTRSRSQARDLIARGKVKVSGAKFTKPGGLVAVDAVVDISVEEDGVVSRGGLKLAHGLDHFKISPDGLVAADLGASTGGFTDVLLRRGAAHVYAIDVGTGQLDPALVKNRRVTVLEGVNLRDLTSDHMPDAPQILVCDVSFISLTMALPPALSLAAPGAYLVGLIKPQFEAGRDHVGKGGIVRDEAVHARICDAISVFIDEGCGWPVLGLVPSPVKGSGGNREFLIAARKPA